MIEQLYHGHPLIDQRRYDKQIIKTKEDTSISQRNKELILQFAENCLKSSHRPKPLRHKRVIKYLACLRQLSLHLNKDFDKATREDIKVLVEWIDTKKENGEWWKHDFKVCLKKFYKTMFGNEDDINFVPEQVRFIRTTMEDEPMANPMDLPKPDDVNKMIEAAQNPRDKCFVRLIFETGMRIGELLKLKIKDIDFSEGYIYCSGTKTKWSNRIIPIKESIPLLVQLLESHPYKNNKESLLWLSSQPKYVDEDGERKKIYPPLGYTSVLHMLSSLAETSGVDKKVNPHSFRKASATEDGKYMSYTNLCVMKGWKIGSDVASVYVRPTKSDLKSAKDNGMEAPKINPNQPKQCILCDTVNDPIARFCYKCGHTFSKEDALEKLTKERKLLELLMQPKVRDYLLKMIEEQKISKQ